MTTRDTIDPVTEERRWIRFEGCVNFRDMGGYPTVDGRTTRWDVLFRSATLAGMSEADIVRARDEIGLRTVIDLRLPVELEQAGTAACVDGRCVHLKHISLNRTSWPDDDQPPNLSDLGTTYLWMLRGMHDAVGDVLRLLADEATYPAVFHCAGGKDRTGIIAAFLLDILGVSDETIVADYHLTERSRDHIPEADREAAFRRVRDEGLPEEVLFARADTMRRFLVGVRDDYGSVRGYLERCGIGETEIARLRELLLT